MELKFHSVLFLILAVIFLCGVPTNSQLYENDGCYILGSGQQGVCKYPNDCPWATEQFRFSGIRPTNCGFDGNSVIICCLQGSGGGGNSNQGNNNQNVGVNSRNPGTQFGNNINFGQRPSTNNNNNQFNGNRDVSSNSNNNNNGNSGSNAGSGDFDTTAAVNSRRNNGIKSISERKCDTYSASVTQVVEGLLLLPQPETLTIKVPKCDYSSTPLIVGGTEAEVGEFPHMALIGWPLAGRRDYKWACGGSLISENFVLTAGHCASLDRDTSVSSVDPTVIRLGEHSISRTDDVPVIQDIDIESVIVHPAYDPPSKYHDIALIRMRRPARFGNNVRPACLSPSLYADGEPSVATGWGRIAYAKQPSDVLLKVSIKVISNPRCGPMYESVSRRTLPRGIIDQQLCAGDVGRDTCQGDSGGPLQVSDSANRCIFHVIGVTSFGSGCGGPNSPGVYTSVAHYLRWIEGIVWPSG